MNQDESVVLRNRINRLVPLIKFTDPMNKLPLPKRFSFVMVCVAFWFFLTFVLMLIPLVADSIIADRKDKLPLFYVLWDQIEECSVPGCQERRTLTSSIADEIYVTCPSCGCYMVDKNGTISYV